METLDRCFENVCELDLIFHVDRVQNILQEICMGGMVLETNMSEILVHVEAQNKLEKAESSPTSTIRVSRNYILKIKYMIQAWMSKESEVLIIHFYCFIEHCFISSQ